LATVASHFATLQVSGKKYFSPYRNFILIQDGRIIQ